MLPFKKQLNQRGKVCICGHYVPALRFYTEEYNSLEIHRISKGKKHNNLNRDNSG